jgi:hypothetical protein
MKLPSSRTSLAAAMAWAVPHASVAVTAGPQEDVRVSQMAQRVRSIPFGSSVEVRMKSNERVKGKLGSVCEDGFDVHPAKAAANPVRLAFADVQSVSQKRMGTGAKVGIWIGIGVGAAVVVTLVVLTAVHPYG